MSFGFLHTHTYETHFKVIMRGCGLPALDHEVVDWSGAARGRGLTVLACHQSNYLGNYRDSLNEVCRVSLCVWGGGGGGSSYDWVGEIMEWFVSE